MNSSGMGGLTPDEELLFVLTALSDAEPSAAAHETSVVADRLGWEVPEVDVCAVGLERRGLAGRVSTMNGTPWAYAVGPTDAAFLWRDRTAANWAAVEVSAVDWLMALGAGGGVASRDLAAATGMHERGAQALLGEWEAQGAVRDAHALSSFGVVALATGLRP